MQSNLHYFRISVSNSLVMDLLSNSNVFDNQNCCIKNQISYNFYYIKSKLFE